MIKNNNILKTLSAIIVTSVSFSNAQTTQDIVDVVKVIPSSFDILDTTNLLKIDKLMSQNPAISVEKIASLVDPSSQDVAEIHRGITLWLLTRLELLENETNKDILKVRLEEIANRFYLLKKVTKANKLAKPGKFSILKTEHEKVTQLIEKIPIDSPPSRTADRVFQKLGLLDQEHVIYSIRMWMSSPK